LASQSMKGLATQKQVIVSKRIIIFFCVFYLVGCPILFFITSKYTWICLVTVFYAVCVSVAFIRGSLCCLIY
jgi:hypothetical protein